MRRYQYRLNDQNISLANWGQVTPLKYIQTVPGETYGGTISVKPQSALTVKQVHSRAYYDLYAFYCPYRLLWEEFPDFIGGNNQSGTATAVPKTLSLFPQNFEGSYVGLDGVLSQEGQGVNAVFLRRMYHLCYYAFFEGHKDNDNDRFNHCQEVRNGDCDEFTELLPAEARPSTFDTSWYTDTSTKEQKIAVTNGEVSLENIRRAYSLDRFERIRDHYGSRYTDLLRSYGVKASWGILEEPECIGISNNDFKFTVNRSTGDANYGSRRGHFEGDYKLKLRKTFTPEHGLIGIFAVARVDKINTSMGAHIACTTIDEPTQYFDPHTWDSYTQQSFPKNLLNQMDNRGMRAVSPLGEHLRKGRNESALPAGTDPDKLPIIGKNGIKANYENHILHRRDVCVPPADLFVSGMSRESKDEKETRNYPARLTGLEISHYNEVRIAKRSPVKPATAVMKQR